mmetsp:Transcript_20431/g.48554  ORF Transcript_20431/g.48554 Transcript_20431/m.48554 type:complete len:638 (-) Transcript_20431:769-2682(-)
MVPPQPQPQPQPSAPPAAADYYYEPNSNLYNNNNNNNNNTWMHLQSTTTTTNTASSSYSQPYSRQQEPYVTSAAVSATTQPHVNVLDEDERLARQLQQQEEQYAAAVASANASDSPTAASTRSPPPPPGVVVRGSLVSAQQQEQSSYFMQSPSPANSNNYRQQSDFLDERTSSMDNSDSADRRIAQELQDAEVAARLAQQEQERYSARQSQQQQLQRDEAIAAAMQQNQQQPSHRSCFRKYVLPLMILGAAAGTFAVLFVTGVFDSEDFANLGDIFGGDPWRGNTTTVVIDCDDSSQECGPAVDPNTAYGWLSPNGNGITVEILNAVEDRWVSTVEQAVLNWEDGYPIDSLTLPLTRVDVESECSAVQGKLKICNGNYGATRWRGLNEVMLSGRNQNRIRSSTARLNDYYLDREGPSQKLYTACHELGHGFGLPHWDENFYNQDLGNCMDYTTNPGQNSKPDTSNFLYLAQLYGGRNVTSDSQSGNGNGEFAATTAEEELIPEEAGGGDRRRRGRSLSLRRQKQQQQQQLEDESTPSSSSSSLLEESQSVLDFKLLPTLPKHQRRRVVVKAKDHEVHVVENIRRRDLLDNTIDESADEVRTKFVMAMAEGNDDEDGDDDDDEEEYYTLVQHYLLYVP